jgi:mannitol-1-/sugar-/sorbitol-6-phosphatase
VTERLGFPGGIEAVLFDMDGTLVDSDAAVERAWRTWAGEHGIDPSAALAIAPGRPAGQTVRALLPGAGDETVAAAAARQLALQYDDLADVAAASGAPGLLARIAMPWAVVTSADRRLANARLRAAGICPPLLIAAEDVPAGKPDPAGYRLAAARLGADPRRCLVVEDSAVGIEAGRAAGARVAALKGLPGDIEITCLGELAGLLSEDRKKREGP